GATVVGVVEDAAAPGLTEVVHLEVVAGLDERTRPLVEHLDLKVSGRAAFGKGDLGLVAEGAGRGGQVRGHELPLVGAGRRWPPSIVPDLVAVRSCGRAARTSARGAYAATRAGVTTGRPGHPRAR